MDVKVKTLHAVIDRLAEKTDCAPDFSGFRAMSEAIGLRNSNYLYMKVYLRIRGLSDGTIGLNPFNLNEIARFLKFRSFRELELSLSNVTPQAQSLVGTYYSYVRANLSKPTLLRSPVRVFESGGKIWFDLKGPNIQYKGEVGIRDGCLFVLMTSKAGKEFHHVYKVGTRQAPQVLQGVFSGVSTAFDPIGGRTVLVKQDDGSKLKNEMIDIARLKVSKERNERILARYFWKYENNNVAPGKSATFWFEDLT